MTKIEKEKKHFVVDNLIKIMSAREMTKSSFADKIGFLESKWNKISNGNQNLTVNDLSKIAEKLQMREIDILTYPDKYYATNKKESDVKAQITVELKADLKEQVLQLVFGKSDLEILNK
ncbi:MAG: helix-turn-helix transcriptional regulator [Tannerellaceae bacterium]|jgi:DNA-binding Xre family transcriptional regulator|nr:helix-turn-helix transcriptional regulator [Tannerellaceae bacterium]